MFNIITNHIKLNSLFHLRSYQRHKVPLIVLIAAKFLRLNYGIFLEVLLFPSAGVKHAIKILYKFTTFN